MESVYLETTFISYLTARPSRDLLVAAHQQTTQEWWVTRKDKLSCYVSQVVIDEVAAGDPAESQKRLATINDLPALDVTREAEELTKHILSSGALPPSAVRDAAHVAVAAIHGMEYLLTWNCRHLANAQIKQKIESVCQAFGYRMAIIFTPGELM